MSKENDELIYDLREAVMTIRELRRQNELLAARVETMELFGQFLRAHVPGRGELACPDIAWTLERRIQCIEDGAQPEEAGDVYGKIGDDPPCSCPIIRRYAIGLNDRFEDTERQRLKPFILRVVGNRDPAAEGARLQFIVLETARRVLPIAFECRQPTIAAELRSISDDISFADLRDRLRKIRANAAAYASAAAASYASADASAAASYAAAAASYASAAAASYAAYASAAAASAADARRRIIEESIWILDNVLRIGKQSPEFDEADVRRSVEAFDFARLVKKRAEVG